MTLPASLFRRLRNAHSTTAAAAAEKALAGQPVTDDLARLKEYEQLIDLARRPTRTNLIAAAAVGAACLLIAGFAWAWRVPTKVHGTITADAITFRLADAWHWSGNWRLSDGLFRIDEVEELTLPPELSAQPELRGRAWLDVERGQPALSDLELDAHGTLGLLRNPTGTIHLLIAKAALRGHAQISGAPVLSAGEMPAQPASLRTSQWEIPGIIGFYDSGQRSIPARIELSAKDSIVWRNIPIDRLSFVQEAGAGEGPTFISGIRSGTLTVSETDEKFTLREKDHLSLDLAWGIIQELELGSDVLRISFEAQARKVSSGVTGLEVDLAPTLLSYIYHQQRLGFFWGFVGVLWGALWSARQLLFK
ncbi:MAG TPA: hypothetical protein VGX95_04285 [Xanthobacteraceae bacterium]|jgi:hypothetical protein|nr:hypothetical protein [Xanthobacteraceae bacterium]